MLLGTPFPRVPTWAAKSEKHPQKAAGPRDVGGIITEQFFEP